MTEAFVWLDPPGRSSDVAPLPTIHRLSPVVNWSLLIRIPLKF
jgi:hypothetical protein